MQHIGISDRRSAKKLKSKIENLKIKDENRSSLRTSLAMSECVVGSNPEYGSLTLDRRASLAMTTPSVCHSGPRAGIQMFF